MLLSMTLLMLLTVSMTRSMTVLADYGWYCTYTTFNWFGTVWYHTRNCLALLVRGFTGEIGVNADCMYSKSLIYTPTWILMRGHIKE